MNSKQTVIEAIHLNRTDRTPVALLSGGVWTFNRQGHSLQDILNQPELAAEIIATTNQEVRSDIVWPGSGYHNLAIRALGGQIRFRPKGAPDVLEPALEAVSGLDNIPWERLYDDEGIRNLWKMAEFVVHDVGMHTLVGTSQWGPFTLAGHLYGIEKLMRSIYKDPDAAFTLLEYTSELCFRYLEPFVEAGVEIVSVADPSASGDLISRSQFERFVVPYLKKTITKLHQRGVLVCLHICGNITSRLDLIPETGADFLSVDYKVDLLRVKEVLGGKMSFSGNMNPVGIMQNATAAEVAAVCRECCEKAGSAPGYILMPGCDIPPGVPLENLQSMVETAHDGRK